MLLPPRKPPALPDDSEETESAETDDMPSSCVYIHSPLPNTQFFNLNANAKDSKCDEDFLSDLLTADGSSNG
jgi:hypothetical protein